jgi:hypothetical protein
LMFYISLRIERENPQLRCEINEHKYLIPFILTIYFLIQKFIFIFYYLKMIYK